MSLETYKTAQEPLPHTMLRWHLYGAGLENLGRNGQPEEVEVPAFGPEELLVRQDACGLCFSDTKVINLGENHPRMSGRKLAVDPVTLGHEVSCTVVGVGEKLKDTYHIGQRFVIQADIFYKGKSMAYGYAIKGGLAEYSVIPKPILEGDEGCYLLPLRSDTGYAESALTEPWACVVSSYAHTHRNGLKDGGNLLILEGKTASALDLSSLKSEGHKPGLQLSTRDGKSISGEDGADRGTVSDWAELKAKFTDGQGFDDILVTGDVVPELVEGAASTLADHGIMAFVGVTQFPRRLSLDIGRIHYNWHNYIGIPGTDLSTLYAEPRTADLKAGGLCWIIGAGGPMGQMHVQRAVMHPQPPKRLVCTDVDPIRLQSIVDRLGSIASERGVELIILNPKELGDDRFNSELKRLSEGRGFDDILSMVPVAALIEHAEQYLANGAWFNIFAGVARGTMANIDVNSIIQKRVRYIGSSGSSLTDMRETLSRVESDELSTNASLAAIGGMNAVKDGLQAVKEGWFPGKTLIFPLIHDLPLTPLPSLKEALPSVYARLKDGKFWTQEAEEELLRLKLH